MSRVVLGPPSSVATPGSRVAPRQARPEDIVATANTRPGWVPGGAGNKGVLHPYFFRVSSILARGGLQDLEQMKGLRDRGYRSIVSLREENNYDQLNAPKAGLRPFQVATRDNEQPTIEQMRSFLDFVAEPKNQPAYVHCWGGIGRTGIAVACYRMGLEGWNPGQAIAEAKAFGAFMPDQLAFIEKFGQALGWRQVGTKWTQTAPVDPQLAGYPRDIRPPATSPWKKGTPVKEYAFQVSPQLTRGSRLDERRVKELASQGFRAVVNLRGEDDSETPLVAGAGMKPKRLELEEYAVPSVAHVLDFLDFVSKRENQPAYVHCNRGINRTGIMVAAYRMAVQGWSPAKAIAEAKEFGMNIPQELHFLEDFGNALQAGIFKGYPLATAESTARIGDQFDVQPAATAPAPGSPPAPPAAAWWPQSLDFE